VEEGKLTYSDCTQQSEWRNMERHKEEDVEGKTKENQEKRKKGEGLETEPR
jgi:hypothetical protein